MILFVDTSISETPLSPNKVLVQELAAVQHPHTSYKPRSKVDIFKYSVASYEGIEWEQSIFRVEGDSINFDCDLYPFVKECFPNCDISNKRSVTGNEYLDAFQKIKAANPWVFFSPNNDHPFIYSDESIFEKLIPVAEAAEAKYRLPVSILFSHFTESINSIHPTGYLFGYTGQWCEVVDECEHAFVVKYPTIQLLSLQIFRRRFLENLFGIAGSRRVIRTECLGQYIDINSPSIVVVPKMELCRHYDGYMHTQFVERRFVTSSMVPPLFVPDGFFESDIKLRFGFNDYEAGWVNINPNANAYVFEASDGVDVGWELDDIPPFWQRRLGILDESPDFVTSSDSGVLQSRINDPWSNVGVIERKARIISRRLKFSRFGRILRSSFFSALAFLKCFRH